MTELFGTENIIIEPGYQFYNEEDIEAEITFTILDVNQKLMLDNIKSFINSHNKKPKIRKRIKC